MVATGKTLDLFDGEAGAQRPRKERRTKQAPRLSLIPPRPPPRMAPRELWLAIHVPRLALLSLQETPATAFAVIAAEGNAQHVVACNERAAAAGVSPGMPLKAAYALEANLQTSLRDEAAELRLLEALAVRAGRFTPRVCVEAPDALLLEIKGSLGLFGGMQPLVDSIAVEMAGQGVEACLSLAPAPLAALTLARAGRSVIVDSPAQLTTHVGALPIAHLAQSVNQGGSDLSETLQSLRDAGVDTIGHCARLPRAGLARRFGPQFVELLDRVLGRAPRPTRTYVERERFARHRDFEMEIEDHERLKRQVRPLLTELARFLRKRDATIQAFEIVLRHRERAPTRLRIRFVTPVRDGAHFMAVLAERLERVKLQAPVLSAHLRSGPLMPPDSMHIEAATEHALLREAADRAAAAMPRLIERLQARLGPNAVYGVRAVAEHRPEKAWKKQQGGRKERDGRKKDAETTGRLLHAPRPFWLLSEPQSLQSVRGRPQYQGALEIESGPERLEGGWWDEADVSRDYYVARTPGGLRIWIYRERSQSRRWWLHGFFG